MDLLMILLSVFTVFFIIISLIVMWYWIRIANSILNTVSRRAERERDESKRTKNEERKRFRIDD